MAQTPALIALDMDLKPVDPTKQDQTQTHQEDQGQIPIRGVRVRTPTLRVVATDLIGVITMTRIRVTTITPIRGTVTKVIETIISTDLVIRRAIIEVVAILPILEVSVPQ